MRAKSIIFGLGIPVLLSGCHLSKEPKKSSIFDAQNPSAEDFSDLGYIASSQDPARTQCSGIFVSRHVFLTAASCFQSVAQPILLQNDQSFRNIRVLDAGNPSVRGGIKQTGRDLAILSVDDHTRDSTTALGSRDHLNERQTSQTFVYECIGDGQCYYLMAGMGRKKNNDEYGLHWRNVPLRTPFSRSGDEFHAGRFSFSICEGDFGSPVYRVVESQKFLIGIASRYFTPAETNCQESDGAIYTNLTFPEVRNRIDQFVREDV